MAAAVMLANMVPPSKYSAKAPMYPSPQVIEDRYIDDEKLWEICKEKFGPDNYKLKVCVS